MHVSRRQFASQENGKKSKGPKTMEGRQRSSQNAYRHGLSIAVSQNPAMPQNTHRVALAITGGDTNPTILDLGRQVAEAQLDLLRIRQTRTRVLTEERFQKVDLKKSQMPKQPKRVYRSANYGKPGTINGKKILTPEEEDELFNRLLKSLDAAMLPPPPSMKEMFNTIEKIDALERYERRALSRRKKALRALDDFRLGKSLGQF